MNQAAKFEKLAGFVDQEFRSEISQLYLRVKDGSLNPEQETWLKAKLEAMLRDLQVKCGQEKSGQEGCNGVTEKKG